MPKIGYINWNGVRSDSLGLIVSGAGSYNAAEPDVTAYEVPGRSGDIIISNNRYKNIQVVYPAFVPKGLDSQVQAIRNWMRSTDGYARLEDNYDTTHYRMARPVGVLEINPEHRNDGANLQLVFDCKPQRFYRNDYYEPTLGSSIINPTPFPAYPIFRVWSPFQNNGIEMRFWTLGGTEFAVYEFRFTQTILDKQVVIDTETQNVYQYNGTETYNDIVVCSKDCGGGTHIPVDWPAIPGNTRAIFNWDFTDPLTDLKITARWWEL